MTKKSKWTKVGVIGVDGGLVHVSDPCYCGDAQVNEAVRIEYDKENWFRSLQVNYKMGHAGLSVVVPSGFGDGIYDVFIKTANCKKWGVRITDLKVTFIKESEL
jgi:hypothetical protein